MSDAVFRFSSPGLTVEFEGPEEFVAAQLRLVLEKVRSEMKGAGAVVADLADYACSATRLLRARERAKAKVTAPVTHLRFARR